MQAPKARNSSSELPQKTSPVTPRTTRKLKTQDLVSSPNGTSKMPKNRSPNVADRRSPRSPVTEKKRTAGTAELETKLAHLQEELKKAKDQLSSSESSNKKAQYEAEEAKKKLLAMSVKFEESVKQLRELSESEEARLQELRKISQDRDRAWQSELEAIQNQHDMDSAALSSALNEIQKLKIQLERVVESEAEQARHAESAHADVQNLRMELTETLVMLEKMKAQLNDSKESEDRVLEELRNSQMQLEVAKEVEETLRSEGIQAMEAYKSLALEFQESQQQVVSLEELVRELQATISEGKKDSTTPHNVENVTLKDNSVEALQPQDEKIEVSKLRDALESSERRYQEEYIRSTLEIRNAFDLVEKTKSESSQREAELEAKLKVAISSTEELKQKLMEKEIQFKDTGEENRRLYQEIESSHPVEVLNLESILKDLKVNLKDKEAELQSVTEENEKLKLEMRNKEEERSRLNDEAVALVEAARTTEQEALLKLNHLTEEVDKSTKKAARVTEQLDAAQAANTDMEAELRRLKVQADQWRKAAEAAATMLSNGNNGKLVEGTGSMGYNTIGGKLNLPYSEDLDDDSPKKKNGNMLKKIGVLLKKGQK